MKKIYIEYNSTNGKYYIYDGFGDDYTIFESFEDKKEALDFAKRFSSNIVAFNS